MTLIKFTKLQRETDEESNISPEETDHSFEMHNTTLPEYELDETKGFLNEDFIKVIKDKKERKDFLNEYFYRRIREEKELDEINNIENQLQS